MNETEFEIKKLKSKIAPTNLSFRRKDYRFGDTYKKIFTIVNFPPYIYAGILSLIVREQNIKTELLIEQTNLDLTKLLNNEIRQMDTEYRKCKDVKRKDELQKKMEEYDEYINNLNSRRDADVNVLLNLTISATDLGRLHETETSLRALLNGYNYQFDSLYGLVDYTFYKTSPFFPVDRFSKDIAGNLGCIMTTQSLAALYPFIFDTLDDKYGLLLGYESTNYGKIMFDQFLYLNDKATAQKYSRLNGNMVIIGSSGSGKTTALNGIMMGHMVEKHKIIWIDPENKIRSLIQRTNGSFFNLGTKSAMINIFDLKPISSDEDSTFNDMDMWNTEIAIYNVIEDVKIVLQYLNPELNQETLNYLGPLIIETYERQGINFETNFRNFSVEKYPTFTDLAVTIKEKITTYEQYDDLKDNIELLSLRRLNNSINPLITEYSQYFDGVTTINQQSTANPFIGFGVKVFFQIRDELKTALMHIIIKYAWSLCLDDTEHSVLALDEAHTVIQLGQTARHIEQFARRSRKYKNCLITCTQESYDFATNETLTQGKAIFNNSTYKLVMNLEENAIEDLNKLMRLSDGENDLIYSLGQGQGIFIAGTKRIPINIKTTKKMLELME